MTDFDLYVFGSLMKPRFYKPDYRKFIDGFASYKTILPVFCARDKRCDVAKILGDVDKAMMKLLFVNR